MFFDFLRRRVVLLVLAGSLMLTASGCLYVVVGSVGALGGYVVSPDTVEGIISNYEQETIWEAAVDVAANRGLFIEENDAAGILIAKIDGAKVTISVFRVDADNIKLTIKARRSFFPRLKLAQDIYTRVVDSLTK